MAGSHPPHQELLRYLEILPVNTLQNILMSTADREIALSMMYLDDRQRADIFKLLPGKKQQRIREEILLQKRLRITYKQYLLALNNLINSLAKAKPQGSLRTYLRPHQ